MSASPADKKRANSGAAAEEPEKKKGGIVGGGTQEEEDELLAMEREMAEEMAAGDYADLAEEHEAPAAPISLSSSFGASGGALAMEDGATGTEVNEKWKRPDVAADFDSATSSLAFQWTAVDLMTGDVLAEHPKGQGHSVPGAAVGPVPIIR